MLYNIFVTCRRPDRQLDSTVVKAAGVGKVTCGLGLGPGLRAETGHCLVRMGEQRQVVEQAGGSGNVDFIAHHGRRSMPLTD